MIGGILNHRVVLTTLNIRVSYSNSKIFTVLNFDRTDDVSILDAVSFYFDNFVP